MEYDQSRLTSQLREFPWFRTANADPQGPTFDGFAFFNYTPWHIAKGDDNLRYVSSLVLDFKKNEAGAVKAVTAIATQVLETLIGYGIWNGKQVAEESVSQPNRWAMTKGASDGGGGWFGRDTLVIPGSGKGLGKPCTNAFARAIENVLFHDLDPDNPFGPSRFALERHTAQSPSHLQRHSLSDHLKTMRIVDNPKVDSSFGFAPLHKYVLIDDVYTTGATYGAGKQLLLERFPSSDVIGMFLAVTAY